MLSILKSKINILQHNYNFIRQMKYINVNYINVNYHDVKKIKQQFQLYKSQSIIYISHLKEIDQPDQLYKINKIEQITDLESKLNNIEEKYIQLKKELNQ